MAEKAEKVVVSKDVVACSVENNAVLLNLADGTYHELNPVAARSGSCRKTLGAPKKL
jgi:hypothetical protein